MMLAVWTGTSWAIRTRSNLDPGLPSIEMLISDCSIPSRADSRATTSSRCENGRSDGSDLDRIARFVRDQLTAAPVEDQATGRWQGLRDGPVLLGTGLVDLAADELEVDEPGRESADPDQDRDPEDQEADELALARRSLVDDRRGYHATRSRSADRRRSAIAIGPTTAATAVL